ncbi:MAG: ATP-binding cassette domain-containing protein [Clostridia bacterium]|nr:ATP-binding cassette domain-containing protein [Clostridia bacterium]
MIKVENLSYGFPSKDLYNKISFEILPRQKYALVGANGSGKSTLLDMLTSSKDYLYDGSINIDPDARIGYAYQFDTSKKSEDISVMDFLSERYIQLEEKINETFPLMESDPEKGMELYQQLLDIKDAMDGDNFEANILKTLHSVGMTYLKDFKLPDISGGEFKVLQVMSEMLVKPNLLILDEPDAFLDFGNINSLVKLINDYEGTMLVATHNRYLLNHCFDHILHLENGALNCYEGNYTNYRAYILKEKLRLKKLSIDDEKEIERTQELVETLRARATDMVNPVIGKSVHAKQSQLDRLKARKIDSPFIQTRRPKITLPIINTEESKVVLKTEDFELVSGEKVAIAGDNGSGKTTALKDILSSHINASYGVMRQIQGDLDLEKTTHELLLPYFKNEKEILSYLKGYCLEDIDIYTKVRNLSGGEYNLLQVVMLSLSSAELLILDEPTSHLDIYAQQALEEALKAYKGTVLMVSHDFYLITNVADYVLYTEDNQLTRMRSRKFRKMVYDKYFSPEYFELDRKKQEIEKNINDAYEREDLEKVEKLCEDMEKVCK